LEYGFAEVERALASFHSIADDKRSAFVSRLQHLQKLKFPPGVNTGRGRAARYQPHHVFLIAIALQFNELGMNPDRAIRMIRRNLGELAAGVVAALSPSPWHLSSPLICYVPTSGLEDLATHHASDVGLKIDTLENHLTWNEQLTRQFKDRPALFARMCWFTFSAVVFGLPFYLAGLEVGEPEDEKAALTEAAAFWDQLKEWAAPLACEPGRDAEIRREANGFNS